MSRRFDVVGIGLAVYDSALLVDTFPGIDTKIDALEAWHGGGGPVPTALVALARWGVKSAFVGRVGDDLWGRAVRDEMRNAGVNVDHLELDPDLQTPQASIWVEAHSGSRTAVLGTTNYSQPRQIPPGVIENASLLHFDARDPQKCMAAAQRARNSGVSVSLDVGSPRMNVVPVLPLVNHLVIAERFARALSGESTPQAMLETIWEPHFDSVAITFGRRGSIGRAPEERQASVGAYHVETVDTTGAGDIYHAGYLYGTLNGWAVSRRLRFAAAAGALAATALGARGRVPSLTEVEALARTEIPPFQE